MHYESNQSDDRQNPMHMFLWIIAVITAAVVMLGITVMFHISKSTADGRKMNSYVLGKASQAGYIGIEITYDKEPVDIVLYDPSQNKYLPEMSEKTYYRIDEEKHTVTLLADSDNLGIWSAEFNTKSNKNLEYCMVETPSGTLYVTKPVIYIGDDGQYYMKFTTTLSGSDETSAKCNMTLNKSNFSYGLKPAEITLNEEAHVLLEFPEHVFTDEDYRLRVNIATESKKTANTSVDIHLNARRTPEPVENNETPDKE